jgi:hypothetical protein
MSLIFVDDDGKLGNACGWTIRNGGGGADEGSKQGNRKG